jgi:hypothetical protein
MVVVRRKGSEIVEEEVRIGMPRGLQVEVLHEQLGCRVYRSSMIGMSIG